MYARWDQAAKAAYFSFQMILDVCCQLDALTAMLLPPAIGSMQKT